MGLFTSAKKSLPLSSTMMNAGKSTTSIFQIASMPSSAYSTTSTCLMQSCAIALGKHGIRCNSVLPGTILTDINKDDLSDPKKREYMEGRIPLGRLGQPEDIGGAVAFLASDMAAYVTGAALLVDGGAFVNLQ